MNIKGILKAGMILLVLGFFLNIIGVATASDATEDIVDDIEEYNGSVGPDNALYGLKLAFENIDESFTWNATEKLGKKVSHSRLRISEAKTELKNKNNEAAEKAFEHYKEKVKETEESILEIPGNDSGILNAQKMFKEHQYVLEQLLESHPNNTGLLNAYNNSLELENKFELKTEIKIERIQTGEGKNILKEAKQESEKSVKENIRDEREKKTDEITQEKQEIKTEEKKTDDITQEKQEIKTEEKKKDEITQEKQEIKTKEKKKED